MPTGAAETILIGSRPRLEEGKMGNDEQNKAAVRACFEQASQGNFDALDDILTGDYVLHPEEVQEIGRASCRERV